MKNSSSGTGSTNVRKTLDVGRLAKALARSGNDTRFWVSYGTVGVSGDDGQFDPTNPHAVYIGPAGVEVDVLLEPLGIPVTCLYKGIQGGLTVSFFSPIKAGDRVLVNMPDGDCLGPPVIAAILHSNHDRMPVGDDGKPIFQNDRVLLHSKGVDVDVRVVGADVTFLTDKNVKIGGRNADEPLIIGNSWKTKMESIIDDVINHKHGSAVGPTTPTAPPEAATLLASKNTLPDQLSTTNFTKKTNDGT